MIRWAALLAVLAIAIAPAGNARAQQKLDGIAAVVNDDVVLESEVEEQLVKFLQLSGLRPDSTQVDTLRRQVLDQLINERLVVAEAKKQGITVADADLDKMVERAIADAKKQFGGEQGFLEQLGREGMTVEQLRERYRNDLRRDGLRSKLLDKLFPKRPVQATEAEAYFKANPAKFPKVPAELRLSVIQIPVSADSVADKKAKADALAARKRIVGGEKFAKVAAEVSGDPNSARSGGDLGFFTRGTMEPSLEDAAFTQKIGEVGPPLRTPYGWHIVEVLERDTLKARGGRDSLDAEGRPLLEAHVRHILIRVPIEDADIARARAQAEKVRDEAVRGADFAVLVKRYSKYEGPASADGDLGFVNLGTLQQGIRSGIESLAIGEVSQPLANAVGFNIFKVTDRKAERAYTLDEVRDELPNAVAELKYRDRVEEWVKGLRAKANVQIR